MYSKYIGSASSHKIPSRAFSIIINFDKSLDQEAAMSHFQLF